MKWNAWKDKYIERRRRDLKVRLLRLASMLVICVMATSLIFGGYAWAEKTVTLVDDGKVREITTFGNTVGAVLRQEGIRLGTQDVVTPTEQEKVVDGMVIDIERAVSVSITVDGGTRKILTRYKTVEKVLADAGITVDGNDIVKPGLSARVVTGMDIKITRVEIKTEEMEVVIPYRIRRLCDYNLKAGESQIEQEGQPGLELQTWRVTLHDGKEVKRTLVSAVMKKAPRDKIIRVGMLNTVTISPGRGTVSRAGEEYHIKDSFIVRATAYTYTDNNTATGVPPRVGGIAVDPRVIPLGSKLFVEGYGYCEAIDTGGLIKGKRIDVFFPTYDQAINWGVKNVKVYLLELLGAIWKFIVG